MSDYQYTMAYIDWEKYGGCFRKLREHPENLMGCVHTMLGEFQQKDLLKGLPGDAPWDSVQQIQTLGRRAVGLSAQGGALDAQTEAALRRHCHLFSDWAQSYFSSSTPPSDHSNSGSGAGGSASSGCGIIPALLLLAGLTFFVLTGRLLG